MVTKVGQRQTWVCVCARSWACAQTDRPRAPASTRLLRCGTALHNTCMQQQQQEQHALQRCLRFTCSRCHHRPAPLCAAYACPPAPRHVADCGGACQSKCALGRGCSTGADCSSGTCNTASGKCSCPTDTVPNSLGGCVAATAAAVRDAPGVNVQPPASVPTSVPTSAPAANRAAGPAGVQFCRNGLLDDTEADIGASFSAIPV